MSMMLRRHGGAGWHGRNRATLQRQDCDDEYQQVMEQDTHGGKS
ncbi:hypothetical protein [Pseudoduganella sp. OTU4001]